MKIGWQTPNALLGKSSVCHWSISLMARQRRDIYGQKHLHRILRQDLKMRTRPTSSQFAPAHSDFGDQLGICISCFRGPWKSPIGLAAVVRQYPFDAYLRGGVWSPLALKLSSASPVIVLCFVPLLLLLSLFCLMLPLHPGRKY